MDEQPSNPASASTSRGRGLQKVFTQRLQFMPRPTTTRSTALALLALMGLVGGLGTGLHSLVHVVGGRIDCWWYGASPCCDVQGSATTTSELPDDGSSSFDKLEVDDHADCPICTLLARFHAPPATVAIHATLSLLHDDVATSDQLFLSRVTPTAHRPRGPPAWT